MGRRLLSLLLLSGLPACVGEVDPGADRLIDGPRWQAPPAQPRQAVAPSSAPDGSGEFTPPDRPVRGAQQPPAAQGPALREGPLPTPWPDRALAVVGRRVSRRVIASEHMVGVAALANDGLLALSAGGGLFATADWRPLRSQRTPLPAEGFTRLHGWGARLLACRPAGAWSSDDGGRAWRAEPFGCDADGRVTVAVAGSRRYRLEGAGVVRERWPDGRLLGRTVLPLDEPQALAAFDQTVVVFGATGVARSLDGGLHFERGTRADEGRLAVRAVRFVSKTRAVAVGAAPADGGAALLSSDGGLTWRSVPLPRRAEDLRDVATTASGALVAVTSPQHGQAFESVDGGESWQPLAPGAPVALAVATRPRGGVVAASPRGAARVLEAAAVPQSLGLQQPLWAVAVSHPLVAVGAGAEAGLFRTVDGGGTWAAVPGTTGVRFDDVRRVQGHRVVAVGDGLLWASDDAGRQWARAVPPASCQARWVRFAGPVGVVACGDGQSLRSEDQGATWAVGPPLPAALGPVAWLDGGLGLAPRLDGLGAALTVDGGLSWTLNEGPALVDVQPGGAGWTGVTRGGHLWTTPPAGDDWARLESGALGETVAHRWTVDGALVRLAPDGLWRHGAGVAERLAPTPGAHAVALLGDGGALVLQAHAATALSPR